MHGLVPRLVAAIASFAIAAAGVRPPASAQTPAGVIMGAVSGTDGRPIAHAAIRATGAAGDYHALSDARGDFTIPKVATGTYTISAELAGYARAVVSGVAVAAGRTAVVDIRLAAELQTIGVTRAPEVGIGAGTTSETSTLSGAAAAARAPAADAAGLGAYLAGTVQGAAAAAPGALLDPFGNVVLRGGKVSDTVSNTIPSRSRKV